MWRAGQLRCIYRGGRSAGQYSSNCNYSEGEGGRGVIPVILTSGSGGKVEVACTPQSHILYMIRDWTAREETRRPSARQWSAEYLLPWEILGPAAAAPPPPLLLLLLLLQCLGGVGRRRPTGPRSNIFTWRGIKIFCPDPRNLYRDNIATAAAAEGLQSASLL